MIIWMLPIMWVPWVLWKGAMAIVAKTLMSDPKTMFAFWVT
jgi:hypothetical protein